MLPIQIHSFNTQGTTSSIICAASKSDTPLLHDGMMIWNNIAFTADEIDEEESVIVCQHNSSPASSDQEGSVVVKHVVEEDQETKFRQELEIELEKKLEQEIMEGILDLVRKLSSLKAKKIVRSLKKLDLDDLLSVLYGSSFDISCKPGNGDEDLYEELLEYSNIQEIKP